MGFRVGRMGLLTLGCSTLLVAQETGAAVADLVGTLKGPGALTRLQVVQVATGRSWQLPCDGEGRFVLRGLPPGAFRLRAEAPGWQPLEFKDLVLKVGTEHRLRLEMARMATVATVVAVTAEEGVTAASVIESAQLEELPLGRRSFVDLSLATPWVLPGRGPAQASAPDSRLSIAGAGPRENSFLVDGCDHNDHGGGTLRAPIPQEGIQEFQVLGAGQGASYGRFLGGVLNAVTRSGGNTPHGSLVVFHRPGSLGARPPEGGGSSDLRLWQVGGHASGPVVKDRLFYSVAVERLRQHDLSQTGFDPTVMAAVQGQGFRLENGPVSREETVSTAMMKLDWIPTVDHTLSFLLLQARERDDAQIPWGGLVARSAGGSRDTRNWTLSLGHRWSPSAAWLVETRLMKAVRDNRMDALDMDDTVQVEIQGAATFGTNRLLPQSTRADYVQAGCVVTGSLGAQVLRAGLDLLETDNQGTVKQNYSGYYLFTALGPMLPTSLAAFQAGYPLAYLQAFGNPYTRFTTGSQALFAEDTWEKGAWSLRVGLRWDRERLAPFADSPDYAALQAPPAISIPPYGPIRLPDGDIAYSRLFQVRQDWSSARVTPRITLRWQPRTDLVTSLGWGEYTGRTALGPLMGMRVSDGSQGFGVLRLLGDAAASWAGDGGKAPGRRYVTAPEGFRVITLPGDYHAPLSRQATFSMVWTAPAALRLTLDGMRSRTEGQAYLRDVNPVITVGGIPRRPDLRYASVYRVDGSGRSEYTSWHLGLERSGSQGAFRVSYTWRRSLDNMVDWTGVNPPQDSLHPEGEWGPGYDDRRHTFLFTGTWRPAPDWTLSALARVGSGRPYTRLAGADLNGNGDGSTDRPEGVGRNQERLPWERRLDLRLTRAFRLGGIHLEAMLDVFNALNAATVATVQNSLASVTPPFGTALTYDPMRQVQLGVRARY